MTQGEEIPQPWVGDPAEQFYANVMGVAAGPFDVTLVFGHQDHAASLRAGTASGSQNQEVVRVAMSWAHLKSMIPLVAKLVADYESQMGDIPAPGFDQNWKE